MIEIKFWLMLVLLIEVPAIALVICHMPLIGILRKIGFGWDMFTGLCLFTFGLCVQVGRSMNYIKFDTYPVDEWFPLWITKDIGGAIMIYCITKLAVSRSRRHFHR